MTMKPIRFTLHYLGKALYTLGQLLGVPSLVLGVWFAIGYLLSRLTIFREGFIKGTPDWYMIMVSPLVIVGVITAMLLVASVVVIISAVTMYTIPYVHSLHPVT